MENKEIIPCTYTEEELEELSMYDLEDMFDEAEMLMEEENEKNLIEL